SGRSGDSSLWSARWSPSGGWRRPPRTSVRGWPRVPRRTTDFSTAELLLWPYPGGEGLQFVVQDQFALAATLIEPDGALIHRGMHLKRRSPLVDGHRSPRG